MQSQRPEPAAWAMEKAQDLQQIKHSRHRLMLRLQRQML
ncbi:Rz1 family lipoprotein [Escherichia coli]